MTASGTPGELDPIALLRALARQEVRFVVVGGIAGALHGSTTLTSDLDIVYERGKRNVERLARALADIGASRRDVPPALPAPLDAPALLDGMNFLLDSRYGPLDCIGETPSGRFTYSQLEPTAKRYEIAGELVVAAVSLDELIRMKRATGRAKDQAEIEILSALRDEPAPGSGATDVPGARPARPRAPRRGPRR